MIDAHEAPSRPRPPVLLAGAAVALAVGACLLGSLGWARPERTTSGWQVAAVPASLLAVVVATGLVCLAVAVVLVRPSSLGLRPATGAWWAMALLSVGAQVWNDLYVAALGDDGGAVIPVFDWLFTFVPALVVGVVTRRQGRRTQLRATLGTGVVALPLLGLGWALYGAFGGVAAGLGGGLYAAAVFGLVPFVLAVLLTRAPAGT